MIYVIARWLCAVFCRIYLRLRVSGLENLPKKGTFILACNHVSFLDPVIFGVACTRQLNYLARSTLFKNWFFGRLLKAIHSIPLKRDSADIGAMREGLKRMKQGHGLLLFPEGTRSRDGNLGRGRHGVGFLARKSGAPVVPAYCKGSELALPKGAKSVKSVPVNVVFGKPMDFTKHPELTEQDIADEIMRQLHLLKNSLG